MHYLDGTGGWKCCGFLSSASFGGGEGQNGPQSFPACEDGVAHGLMDGLGASGYFGKEGVESRIDGFLLRLEIRFQVGHANYLREGKGMPKPESSESHLKYQRYGQP